MATAPTGPRPVLLVVSAEHAELLLDEFGRYTRDYDVRCARSQSEATATLTDIVGEGGRVALVVTDSAVADGEVYRALHEWRGVVPTARKVVAAHMSLFSADGPRLRAGLSTGKYDAFLLMPRGARDEEFHTAVTELLSDWNSTATDPEVVSAKIVGVPHDRVTVEIRDFLDRMGMPNRLYPPDSEVGRMVRERAGSDELPIVMTVRGDVLVARSARDVATRMYGTPADIDVDTSVDLCVVGAGPAGLAAAVYASSEGLSTVVVESEAIGGQAGTSSMIRNYLGFPRGISGMRLAQRARNQAIRFGTRFFTGWEVDSLVLGDDGQDHRVVTAGGDVRARAVLIATGVAYRRLGVEGLEDLVGRGVHYGAAVSSARETEGRDVYVVGGGNSAGQAAVHLAKFARSVTILIRRSALAETMSDYLIREIEYNPVISVRPHSEVVGGGPGEDGQLGWLDLCDTRTRQVERRPAGGLFLLIGAAPRCDWIPDRICLDERGFVLTGRDVPVDLWPGERPPENLATVVPGVFAAGDIRAGSMKRVAAATGEGASVVPLVHAHLALR